VADALGRRRPVLLGTALVASLLALTFFAFTDFLPLLIVAAFQGLAGSAIGPLADSLALALARDGKLEYGPVRSVGSASFMVMTACIGWLLGQFGSIIVPGLQAFWYGVTAAWSVVLPEAASPPVRPHPLAGLGLFRQAAFRLTVMSTAVIQGSHAAFYGFAALYWRSQGISDTTIGLLLAECIVAEVLLFARGRAVVERLGPAGLTGCAAAASVLRWGVSSLVLPVPILALIQPLHAATFGMQHLSAMMMLSRFVPTDRAATAQALHAALGYGAPTGLMTLLAGAVYARFGGAVFLVMAGVSGLGLLLVTPLRRVVRRAGPAGSP
jgi:PPP family 3-phenylpropionic acid transporter